MFQVIFARISLDCTEKKLKICNTIRLKYFWTNEFLTPKRQQQFDRKVKILIYPFVLLWIITYILITMIFTSLTYPKFIYNNEWCMIFKLTVVIIFFLNAAFGYYIGNVHLCYCAYMILHCYFQMTILRTYIIKQTIKNFGINGKKSQWEIRLILKTSIRQFQIINRLVKGNIKKNNNYYSICRYNNEVASMYSRFSPPHFVIGTIIFAISFHALLFVSHLLNRLSYTKSNDFRPITPTYGSFLS